MLKAKIFESQIILKCLGARKPKGLKKQNSQNQLRLPMPEGGEQGLSSVIYRNYSWSSLNLSYVIF
jgi:hypothetical protein